MLEVPGRPELKLELVVVQLVQAQEVVEEQLDYLSMRV